MRVWQNAQRVVLGKSAVRPVSVRMEPGVTTSAADAAVQQDGLESAANCVSSSSLTRKEYSTLWCPTNVKDPGYQS